MLTPRTFREQFAVVLALLALWVEAFHQWTQAVSVHLQQLILIFVQSSALYLMAGTIVALLTFVGAVLYRPTPLAWSKSCITPFFFVA